ncbi:MAG: hypothetical protein KZQ82_11615 [Candidatus Thiodiazotropha sp. (ex Lucinoma annulata)]|nr:hypothetical protein [Candidatus Thiodiazotropha sp. (ex Lucinoma annulata)]
MKHKDCLLGLLFIPWLLFSSDSLHARNCTKGKPCGKGCISLNKTCRIDSNNARTETTTSNNHEISQARSPSVLRRSKLRLPKVYVVTAQSIKTREAPFSKKVTGQYKQGQSVFVYQTDGSWARLSNMQPEEWVELEYLRMK